MNNQMLDMLKKLDENEYFNEVASKLVKKQKLDNSRVYKLRNFINAGNSFETLIESIVKRYESNEYKDYFYNRGIIPPNDLLWVVLDYAKKYGCKCTDNEFDTIANAFTTEMYLVNDYYILRMDGQGSIIKVIKKDPDIFDAETKEIVIKKFQNILMEACFLAKENNWDKFQFELRSIYDAHRLFNIFEVQLQSKSKGNI